MSEPKLIILDDAPSLHVHAAEEIAHFAGEAICMHAEFMLCLSGGSTPAATYELLAERFRLSVDWKEVQFFWGDERCVPPDDPTSNFAMAHRTMLSKLDVRPDQIHRIRGEEAPDQAALDSWTLGRLARHAAASSSMMMVRPFTRRAVRRPSLISAYAVVRPMP